MAALLFVPAALLTDKPSFCPTCHTMVPFYNAWQQGPHKDVWCIDCHVNSGMPSRFEHKFVALGEVYAQFVRHKQRSPTTTPRSPTNVANVATRTCRSRRHTPTSKFSHATHMDKGVQCALCHASTGHKVTFSALADAGLLNTANAPAGLTYVGEQVKASSSAPSSLPGHKPVPCTRCHDQAHLQCSFCHATPSKHYGADCKSCHRPTTPFANFVHPPSGEHSYKSRPCAKCHPNGYQAVYCTCHKGNPPQGD